MKKSAVPIAVLAGGKSRRMGRDKAFIEFAGAPMIQLALSSAKLCSETVLIISNEPDRFSRFGVPAVADIIPGMGPLSGLHTAFMATGADKLMIVSCDLPLVTPEMMGFILDYPCEGAEAVIPFANGYEQGLLAVYMRSGLDRFGDKIAAASIMFDEFRLGLKRIFIEEAALRAVEPDLRSFFNVNTPEDLRAAIGLTRG